jgi:large subunit ribosomal protein L17
MIKNYNTRKLGLTSSHKKAMLKNMATSLFLHEKVQTTNARAKELQRYSERIITAAKPLTLVAKKKVFAEIKDKEIRKKIFEVLVPRYKERNGGYTQIFKIGRRIGDNAQIALVRLVV